MKTVLLRQNIYTAAIAVGVASLFIWIVFNSFVDAYPQRAINYQTPQTTTAVVEPLDYHYTTAP